MLLIILSLIFSPIVFAIGVYIIQNIKLNRGIFLLQTFQSLMFIRLAFLWSLGGDRSFNLGGWTKGIAIELRIAPINILFMSMITLAFWYILFYVWKKRREDHKFLFFTLFLQGSLYAMFCVNDLFTMYILLELNTIISSILIIYKKDGESIRAGFYYLIYNSLAMSIYFLGVIIIYMKVGTLNISMIAENAHLYSGDMIFKFAIALFLSAFALKSAIIPLFSWLPIAHGSAPSSISAVLSGLIVKTGLYGLIIVLSIFSSESLLKLLYVLGIMTSIAGSLYGITRFDIKKKLAYSTVSQIGIAVIGISSYSQNANLGSLMHIFNHFLSKSLLFLCAGAIISASSERNIENIDGLFKKSKTISIGILIGVLSITGMPLFSGYISKSMIKSGDYMFAAGPVFHILNFGTMVLFLKFLRILFDKEPVKIDEIKHLSDKLIDDLSPHNHKENFKIDFYKKTSIIYLSFATIISYLIEFMLLRSNQSFAYIFSPLSLLKALIVYALYFGLAVLAYRKLISKYLKEERRSLGGFQESSAMFVIFIGLILGFFKYFV